MPNQINDTVLAAAQLIVNLQQIVSRLAPPIVPSVLSFGKVIAEGAFNIIPDEVFIQALFALLMKHGEPLPKSIFTALRKPQHKLLI